jgi:hypothetical protein
VYFKRPTTFDKSIACFAREKTFLGEVYSCWGAWGVNSMSVCVFNLSYVCVNWAERRSKQWDNECKHIVQGTALAHKL